MSRSITAALLVAGAVTAAAGGSYIAVRQNAAAVEAPASQPSAEPVLGVVPEPSSPVQETEGVIEAPRPAPPVEPQLEKSPELTPAPRRPEMRRRTVPAPIRERRPPTVRAAAGPTALPAEIAAPVERSTPLPAPDPQPVAERTPAAVDPGPDVRTEPVLTEVVIPASSVIGLEIETTVTSERARIEDRVDARVTRDVFADGRLALPAGSRMIGLVTLVERGGKVKERARLGVRFHTAVLANGRQVSLRTDPIYREGESPAGESSRKIGGAAIGGAVLGAILGGGKGAIAGATAGAAGGTAAVMTGDRNPAVLSSGSIVTVKLAGPAFIDVER